MRFLLYLIGITLLLPQLTWARPVSYGGGTTLMQMNDGDANRLHIHYSPTFRYSLGYKGEYWRDQKWQFHGLQLNYLTKRWNKPASQANIYLKSSVGIAYSDHETFDSATEFAGFVGVSTDWENRRFFTSYESRFYNAGEIERFFSQKARLGVAPYIGDYGDLHTWLMLQVDHHPEKDDPVTLTSLIRLFKGDYLTELGINEDGDALFNLVVRF